MRESEVTIAVRNEVGRIGPDVAMWRNSRGFDKLLRLPYGLGPNGSGDFIACAWGQFVSLELKASSGGVVSDEQRRWIQIVEAAGGIAGVASDVRGAMRLIDEARKRAGK